MRLDLHHQEVVRVFGCWKDEEDWKASVEVTYPLLTWNRGLRQSLVSCMNCRSRRLALAGYASLE
jgi:hypothetical protein